MPTIDIRPFKVDTSNVDIMNAIRRNASSEYQRRIPEATKASVQENLQNLIDYRPSWNEFVEALINRIGLVIVKNNIWSNPLAKFKRGMMQYGDTIEEINVGLIQSKTYSSDRESLERDIFGQYPPEVQSSFHKLNRQEYYPITINEPLLQRAFLDPTGLSSFVTSVMSAPTVSDNWDEFLLTCSLFSEYYKAGGFFKSQIADIGIVGSDGPESRYALRRMREFAGNLKFLSTHYNASGMPVAVNADDLELFITPEALAAIDVEALAGAFNIDKAAMPGRITEIPLEHFNIPGVQAIMTTRDFFVIADSRIDTSSIYNPVTLSNNMFLHHWETISASRFVPAILFTTEAGTVITIASTPVTGITALTVTDGTGATVTKVTRGQMYQVVGSAITNPVNGNNNAISLNIVGNLSTHTYITPLGVLHVGEDEAATNLTINAFAVDSVVPQFTNTTSVTVVGDLLTLWPNPTILSDANLDGVFEVTPAAPVFTVATGNVIIPTVVGVQYQKAAVNVTNGSTQNVVAASTVIFTAIARAGYAITTGAIASWTFTRP